MLIRNALAGAAFVATFGLAGPSAGFDAKDLNADTPPTEALRYGLTSYKSGDTEAALEAFSFAADKGLTSARWKLGQMYANGDGVERDEYKAFELFSEVANAHADDGPRQPSAPYVSNAFVRLGTYYREGIPNSAVQPDLGRARQYFAYAASYYGDASAQLNLARMFYQGEGGDRDLLQAAKWANLAVDKGNAEAKFLLINASVELAWSHLENDKSVYGLYQAAQWAKRAADLDSVEGQALYGHLLFEGKGVSRQPVKGLMYLTIALARADVAATPWILEMHQAARSAATAAEWEAAKQRADEWLAKHPDKLAANAAQ